MASKREKNRRRWYYYMLGLLVLIGLLLIAARLYLNVWTLNYVNNVLANLNGYRGSVESIDIHLYRGAYQLNNLVIKKLDGKIPAPFVAIGTADISIQWGALMHGRIVSNVDLKKPVINFAVKNNTVQNGKEQDWTKPIKDLAPIDINKVTFDEGVITYQDFGTTPQVNVYIHKLNGYVTNLRNVVETGKTLPSHLEASGTSIGGGDLRFDGDMNILKQIPDMRIKAALTKAKLTAFNNYTEAYGAFDFKRGRMDLYVEFDVINDNISGYVKPIITDMSVDIFKSENPINVAWSAIVSAVTSLFTNLPKDQFATRAELSGKLSNVQTDTWTTVWGIIYNAFIEAMTRGFETTDAKEAVESRDEEKPAE